MDYQLHGRVALLAGGAGTLGRAAASALAGEKAQVVIADLNPPDRGQWPFVAMDVTQPSSVAAAVQEVEKSFGRIDILVTLAGVYQGGKVSEISPDDWNRLLQINLTGTFLVCRVVLPRMQQSDYGRIICVASLAGQVGGVVAGANYSASKAGVLSLVKSLAKQSEQPWITVNAVNPGPVQGQMTDAWPPAQREMVRQKIPLQRFAQPQEIADAVTFLASPRAAFIHGAHIDINGGLYMD